MTELPLRQAQVVRHTKETLITVHLGLDSLKPPVINTGVGFLNHMLEQLAHHGLLGLEVDITGDLHIDAHHSVEDCGIVIGQALAQALGDRRGITRYGNAYVPMDDALTRVAIDLSGRAYLAWRVPLERGSLGEMDTELVREWFQAFSLHARATLHVDGLAGFNQHHIVESCFKALARALRQAVAFDAAQGYTIPSTKGHL